MKFLSKQQILMLHSALLTQSSVSGWKQTHRHPCNAGFLGYNSITLAYRDDDLITAILSVASGTMDYAGLLRWLQLILPDFCHGAPAGVLLFCKAKPLQRKAKGSCL